MEFKPQQKCWGFFVYFWKQIKNNLIMERSINTYQALFVALLILKAGSVQNFENMSWVLVFLPLILGTIHGWTAQLMRDLGMMDRVKSTVLEAYIEHLKKRVTRKALRKLNTKQR